MLPGCHTVKFGALTSDGKIGFVAFGRDWSTLRTTTKAADCGNTMRRL